MSDRIAELDSNLLPDATCKCKHHYRLPVYQSYLGLCQITLNNRELQSMLLGLFQMSWGVCWILQK